MTRMRVRCEGRQLPYETTWQNGLHDSGKVIWVSDAYGDHALLPQTPQPFSVDLRDDLAARVHTYRVTVNQYSLNRQE